MIEAAGQLFAEKGFNGVTVRDIAREADTHLSALNYHFKSKQILYREVVMEACRQDSLSEKDKKQLMWVKPKTATNNGRLLIEDDTESLYITVIDNHSTGVIEGSPVLYKK